MHRLRTVLNYMLHHTFITCLLIIKTELNYSKNAENVWWCLSLLCGKNYSDCMYVVDGDDNDNDMGIFLWISAFKFRISKKKNFKWKQNGLLCDTRLCWLLIEKTFFLFLSFVIKKEFCFLTADSRYSRYGGVITYYKWARVLTLCAKLNV